MKGVSPEISLLRLYEEMEGLGTMRMWAMKGKSLREKREEDNGRG